MKNQPSVIFRHDFVRITDEEKAKRVMAILGIQDLLADRRPDDPPVTRCIRYDYHKTHWVVVMAFSGLPIPSDNGHLIVARKKDPSTDAATLAEIDRMIRAATLGAPTVSGLIGVVVDDDRQPN